MFQSNVFLFFAAILALFFAGGIMVRALTWMGRYLRISEYVLSFILAAFATSLPELFVGINSAVQGASNISLGNLVGANVLNVTFVIGVSTLLAKGLTVDRVITKQDVQMIFMMVLFPAFLALDGVLNRLDGALLIFLFGCYAIYLVNQEHAVVPVNAMLPDEFRFAKFLKKLGIFTLGTALLLASSWFVVSSGIAFARAFSLPLYFTGILIAIGTTLPETVFGVRSVFLRHGAMTLGNAFGSVVVNTSLILGLVSVISPITISAPNKVLAGILLTAGLVVVINIAAFLNGKLGRLLGIFLLIIAAFFILLTFGL